MNGLSLRVQPGRCYGFFGRNGAGKTTTIKCLLNLLRPTSGEVQVFGLDPAQHEVAVKSRLAYVPDHVAFYPWMTVRDTLDYFASFRARWNRETERALLDQFRLDPRQKTSHLSKGQRTQLALITADLPRARAARSRRAHVRPRSDRPPRIHPDHHRRVPGRRARTADGVRLHAPDLRVRGAHRRVHHHRTGAQRAHAGRRRRAGALSEDLRAFRDEPPALDLRGRARCSAAAVRSRDRRQRQRGRLSSTV